MIGFEELIKEASHPHSSLQSLIKKRKDW